jgi:hypothetical protein
VGIGGSISLIGETWVAEEEQSLDDSGGRPSTKVTEFGEMELGRTGDIGKLAGSANSHRSIDPLRSASNCNCKIQKLLERTSVHIIPINKIDFSLVSINWTSEIRDVARPRGTGTASCGVRWRMARGLT